MSSHARINSTDERRRVAIPRRSTRGPLDLDDDPLAALSSQNNPQPQSQPQPQPQHASAPTSGSASPTPLKDFSFLQDPTAYHVLPPTALPPPFHSAPHTPSAASPIDSLLLTGHYRLAAIAAARNLVSATPATDHTTLFHLLHVRLACLCLINEHALAAQEAKVFGDVNAAFYRSDGGGTGRERHLVPWALRVLLVRLAALGFGEWRKGVMGYYELARECREELALLRRSDGDGDAEAKEEPDTDTARESEKAMWTARLRDCGVRVANVLVEMGDLEGAGRHLASLRADAHASRDVALMETLVWLRLGDVAAARHTLTSVSASSTPSDNDNDNDTLPEATLHALLHLATAAYPAAVSAFSTLHALHPTDAMITQNLAVCLLYDGRIPDARGLLHDLAFDPDKNTPPFHSLLFNLSTLYELCTERNGDAKVELARHVAGRKGDGRVGWERRSEEFKL